MTFVAQGVSVRHQAGNSEATAFWSTGRSVSQR